MRLAGQFLQLLREQVQPLHLCKSPTCLLAHVHHKHTPAKHLEDAKNRSECLEPCKAPGKKSIWGIFGGNRKQQKCLEKEKKTVNECEHVEFVPDEQAKIDLENISKMGGKAYRTCGTAYILQKERYQQKQPTESSDEEIILAEMIKDPSLKGQCDPMPPFETVSLKLMHLNDRKLHPLYKKLMSIPKNPRPQITSKISKPIKQSYQTRSGPVMPEDFPAHLKINKEMLEKKNILYEFKRAEPPQQMLSRMVEMKQNERPKLMKKAENVEK